MEVIVWCCFGWLKILRNFAAMVLLGLNERVFLIVQVLNRENCSQKNLGMVGLLMGFENFGVKVSVESRILFDWNEVSFWDLE